MTERINSNFNGFNIISTLGSLRASDVTIGNLTVTGFTTTMNVTEQNVVDTNITTGSLNATGITAGNINFTGSIYQNGAVYSPGASLKGFQVSAATSGNSFIPFVAVGSVGVLSPIVYSYDGLNWSSIPSTLGIFSTCYGIAYSSGLNRWVAVGQGLYNIAYSNDGVNWIGVVNSTSIFSSSGQKITYSASLSRWVAVGTGTNSIAYSTDGITWTGVGTSVLSSGGYGIAYNGSNKWVAVGDGAGSNNIAYSSDGISWTGVTGTNIFATYGFGVAYGGGKFVAVGGSGTPNTLAYSSDGISWTGLGTTIFTGNGYGFGVGYGNGKFVAVGRGTYTIAYSSDGMSWTAVSPSNVFSNGRDVAYNSGLSRWVAVGDGGASMAYSSDGISWNYIGLNIIGAGKGIASNGYTSSSLVLSSQRVQYDTNSNYNNTTGTFTAPSSGIYTVNLNGLGNVYITSANTFIPTQGSHTTTAYISAGNTLKCVISGGVVYNWGVNYF